jgi:hypothetical protein
VEKGGAIGECIALSLLVGGRVFDLMVWMIWGELL